MRRVVMVLGLSALAVVLASGCRKHHRRSGPQGNDRGAAEAYWPAAQMTVNEGSSFTVVLTLDQVWFEPVVITLSSSDTSRVTLPATATFPTGVTTQIVAITTMADTDSANSSVTVSATSILDVNSMVIVLRETSVSIGGALGPVTAGPNRALLVTDGPDGFWGTADDTLAVVSGIGSGVPVVTHVTIGAVTPGPQALPVVTGVSDTALVVTNGPDLTLGTTDDGLVEVGGISTATPSVTSTLTLGMLEASEGRRPLMVGTRAVVCTRGTDLVTNFDDSFFVVDGIGTGTLTATTIPFPSGVAFEAPSIPVLVDSLRFMIHLSGPDYVFGTGDDVVYIVVGIGGPIGMALLDVGPILAGRMGQPVLVGPTTAVFVRAGLDGFPGNGDDDYFVAQDITTGPVGFLVPAAARWSTDLQATAIATGSDGVLIPTEGPDSADFTADDTVLFATMLSTVVPPAPTAMAAANSVAGPHGRLVSISSTSAVRINAGPDGLLGTTDDGITLLTALAGAGASASLATGPLQAAAPLVLSTTSVALAGEGADETSGSADDEILEVSGIGTSPVLDSTFPGSFRLCGPGAIVPDGAAFVLFARTAGADGAPGTSDDLLSTGSLP